MMLFIFSFSSVESFGVFDLFFVFDVFSCLSLDILSKKTYQSIKTSLDVNQDRFHSFVQNVL